MHYNDWKMKIENMLCYLNESTFPPILCFNSFSFWMSTWRTSQRSDAIIWNGFLYLGWFSQKASLFNTFYWVSFGRLFLCSSSSSSFIYLNLVHHQSYCVWQAADVFQRQNKTKLTTVTLNWIWCREKKTIEASNPVFAKGLIKME